MTLAKRQRAPMPVVAPRHRLLEEGPLLVEYYISPVAPSLWVAHAEVLRGIPESPGRDLHPRFTATGSTENGAMKALVRELEWYLGESFWQRLPCH